MFRQLELNVIVFFISHQGFVKGLKDSELQCQDETTSIKLPFCLIPGYLKEVPPLINDKPLNVSVFVKFDDIIEVNDNDCTVTFNAELDISWLEPRLKIIRNVSTWNDEDTDFMWTNLDSELSKNVWKPDLDVANVKKFEIKKVLKRQNGLGLYGDKRIWYAFSVQVALYCPRFEYSNYPFDIQICDFHIGSYQWNKESILFNGTMLYNTSLQRSLQYKINNIRPLSFKEGLIDYTGHVYKTNGEIEAYKEVYSTFAIRMEFSRILKPQLICTYLPSFLIVMISWIGFLIGTTSVPGRVMPTVVLLLCLINMR